MKQFENDYQTNLKHFSKLLKEDPYDSNHVGAYGGVNQDIRYGELVDEEIFRDSSILEIGCGTGGFLEYLITKDLLGSGLYCGVDLLEEMQAINQKKYPQYEFHTQDLLKNPLNRKFDVVVFCGVFNIRTENGDKYMKELLQCGYRHCNRLLTFNFISTHVNFMEDKMQYHDPSDILNFCIDNFTTNVLMHHHYWKCDVSCKVYL